MNRELQKLFDGLNEISRSEIRNRLKDSPVGLKLFHFLETNKEENFRNREVVADIYKKELENTEYGILENRYFKLRKKFREEFFSSAENTNDDVLAEEELTHLSAKKMFQRNDRELAYHTWSALEKVCWEKNIFELLPQIIDNLIFCNQVLNKLDRNIELYKRMEEAVKLQADIFKLVSLARKIYEINFRKGISYAKAELSEIKNLAQKNSEYPRFDMCYHHIALYYKLGSADYIEDMQVISRHYGKLKTCFKKYPELVLISYRKNYKQHQQMHYKQMGVFYHYNRCEFEEAHKLMKDFRDMVFEQKEIYGIYKSESLFFNTFNTQRTTLRFADAEKTITSYISFLKDNKNTARLIFAYTLKAILYSESWPQTLGIQPDALKDKLDEYGRQVKGENNVMTSYGEVLLIKSKLFLLEKDFAAAKKLIEKPEAQFFLEKNNLREIFLSFYALMTIKEFSAVALNEFRKKLSHQIAATKLPVALIQLKWIQRLIENKKFMLQ